MLHRLTHRSLRFLVPSVVALSVLAGCGGAPQTAAPTAAPAQAAEQATSAPAATAAPQATSAPAATAAPAAQSEAEIKAGIQQALDLYAKAYNQNDPELLKQVVDQTNLPFRRLVQGRFDTYQQSINAGSGNFSYRVNTVTPRDLGFVQAQVLSNRGAVDWLFRQVDGRWVLSEPTEDQIGKRQKTEDENFIYYTYPWGDDVNPEIIKLMEQARDIVKQKLGKLPDKKAEVYIRPIFGLGSIESSNVLAYYDRGSRPGAPDRMVIFAPHSYAFGAYDPSAGWQPELLGTLAHEYTHLVNNRAFTPIARMSDWMVEGLAEYVSNPDAPLQRSVPRAVATDQIIPIVDTSGNYDKQDLEHLTLLNKDVSLAYGLATTLVAYVNEKYGGMDGFWKLVRAYDKEQNLDKALQDAFGISYDQFDQGWRAWLKQTY